MNRMILSVLLLWSLAEASARAGHEEVLAPGPAGLSIDWKSLTEEEFEDT